MEEGEGEGGGGAKGRWGQGVVVTQMNDVVISEQGVQSHMFIYHLKTSSHIGVFFFLFFCNCTFSGHFSGRVVKLGIPLCALRFFLTCSPLGL